MKIRFTFDTVVADIPDSELFDYLQDLHGSFDGLELKDVSEKELFDALSETDPAEFHSDWGFDLPDAINIERLK